MLKSARQTADEQGALLTELEKKVGAANAQYACILVDDLRADAYEHLTSTYDNLLSKCVVFMVFTSFDTGMGDMLDRTLRRVHRFRIGPLTPDDAVAYVRTRYKVYRSAAANGIGSLPLFPFDETDIRTAVQVRTWRGSKETGPVNLRLVASTLASALTEQLEEIARKIPAFDVQTLPAAQLSQHQIKVAQSYSLVVRK
jgi:hypothetical protein